MELNMDNYMPDCVDKTDHNERSNAFDFIKTILTDFIEFSGDRLFGDINP